MTTCKSASKLSAILVSSYPNIVTTNNDYIVLGGILSNFLYLSWLGSEYITDTCSLYYGVYRLG